MKKVQEIVETLSGIEQDSTVPKNVRTRIKSALVLLEDQNGMALEVKFDKLLQDLDDLSEDPNLPAYTRTQIWGLVSSLESK